ncbi:hypothetical protein Tco_0207045 [Tanacetum coccineum]
MILSPPSSAESATISCWFRWFEVVPEVSGVLVLDAPPNGPAGSDIGVASTKARITSQIVVMAMVAVAIGADMISSKQRRERIIESLLNLPCKIREVLKLDEEMKYLARSLISEQPLLMFGRGYNYATTLEGADVLSVPGQDRVRGNSQVKDNKIDLLVQQYEQFVISEDESIDSAFARFNTIITSLKALDEVLKLLRSEDEELHTWPMTRMAKVKGSALDAGDQNHLFENVTKPPRDKNQRAFRWETVLVSDSCEEELKDLMRDILVAQAPN